MALTTQQTTPPSTTLWGVLAEFRGPAELVRACEAIRERGFVRWDSHSPFPVHGLDRAMGLAPSKVPWVVFVMAMVGAAGGMALQGWTSAIDYPVIIAAKPYFSWPAFVPVTFELGVLFGALGAVFGMLVFARLPAHHHPLFQSKRFDGVTDDRFFVSIEAADPAFEVQQTVRWLEELGAVLVERIEG